MHHPELIGVPILMLADYTLTILGAKMRIAVYSRHFATPTYELNPVWRKAVDRVQWFNWRHFAIVAIVTALLVLLDFIDPLIASDDMPPLFPFLLGVLFGGFGSVCGRHLTNLLIFRYLNRQPGEIAGQVQMSLKLMLKISQFNYVGTIPLAAIVAALVPGETTCGVLLGILVLVVVHFIWGLRAKSAELHEPLAVEVLDEANA